MTPRDDIRPNRYEIELAATVADGIARGYGEAWEPAALIAEGLANSRARCTTIAAGLLEGLEATHQGMSPAALDRFDDGWTPTMVRELVKHHRALVEGITAARVLLPKVLAGEP